MARRLLEQPSMMRLGLVLSFAAALLFVAATPAAAQTVSEGSTDDVSNINGIPVKVGEHNEYHYRFKRTNIGINPLAMIMGAYGVSVAYGFHANVAIRVEATIMKPVGGGDATGYELDVGLPIYLRRTYQGPFVELGVMSRTLTSGYGDEIHHEAGPQALLGWHWTWDSGLNLAFAFGMGRNIAGDRSEYDSELFANGYLKIGYAF